MITINVRADIEQLKRKLSSLQRDHVPFAASVAINNTAIAVQGAISDEARTTLTAKPFTTGRGALYVRRSNKRNLIAEVGYKDIQARYMQYQVVGGRRSHKAFEGALRGLGALPAGYVTVPGKGIRLDGYGNIPRRILSEIIGQLRTRKGTFQKRGKSLSLRALFVVLPGSHDPRVRHLQPGIWQRIDALNGSSSVLPMLLYISSADYRRRLDMQAVARRTVGDLFAPELRAAMDRALATAK